MVRVDTVILYRVLESQSGSKGAAAPRPSFQAADCQMSNPIDLFEKAIAGSPAFYKADPRDSPIMPFPVIPVTGKITALGRMVSFACVSVLIECCGPEFLRGPKLRIEPAPVRDGRTPRSRTSSGQLPNSVRSIPQARLLLTVNEARSIRCLQTCELKVRWRKRGRSDAPNGTLLPPKMCTSLHFLPGLELISG